jgi:hypothetical protein
VSDPRPECSRESSMLSTPSTYASTWDSVSGPPRCSTWPASRAKCSRPLASRSQLAAMSFRNDPSSTRSRTFASISVLKTSIPQLTMSVRGWSPSLPFHSVASPRAVMVGPDPSPRPPAACRRAPPAASGPPRSRSATRRRRRGPPIRSRHCPRRRAGRRERVRCASADD